MTKNHQVCRSLVRCTSFPRHGEVGRQDLKDRLSVISVHVYGKELVQCNRVRPSSFSLSCIYLLQAVFQVLNLFLTNQILEQEILVHGVVTAFRRTRLSPKSNIIWQQNMTYRRSPKIINWIWLHVELWNRAWNIVTIHNSCVIFAMIFTSLQSATWLLIMTTFVQII